MTNLQDHARRELELIGEEPKTIDWYLSVIQAFEAAGHSGGSAAVAIPTLNRLLQFENLKPLTDDPAEWEDCSKVYGSPMWQSFRNSMAFSSDGGKTYTILGEEDSGKEVRHLSVPASV